MDETKVEDAAQARRRHAEGSQREPDAVFYGYTRTASEVLSGQKVRSETGDAAMIDHQYYVKDLGLRIKDVFEKGDTMGFAELINEHWLHKKKRSSGISNERINSLYDDARNGRCLGWEAHRCPG